MQVKYGDISLKSSTLAGRLLFINRMLMKDKGCISLSISFRGKFHKHLVKRRFCLLNSRGRQWSLWLLSVYQVLILIMLLLDSPSFTSWYNYNGEKCTRSERERERERAGACKRETKLVQKIWDWKTSGAQRWEATTTNAAQNLLCDRNTPSHNERKP